MILARLPQALRSKPARGVLMCVDLALPAFAGRGRQLFKSKPRRFLIFDALDGRLARWRRKHAALGRELDSLADVISFGVAPAALEFAAACTRVRLGSATVFCLLWSRSIGRV